jgi:hypothetical protein
MSFPHAWTYPDVGPERSDQHDHAEGIMTSKSENPAEKLADAVSGSDDSRFIFHIFLFLTLKIVGVPSPYSGELPAQEWVEI